MAMGGIEQARFRGMLDTLQTHDPEIDNIVVYSKFVVAYLLQQDGPNPGWRKANIEGPVYLVRRRSSPRYQLLVKNQFSTNDLLDNLHPDWELDCQKNYVFYKVEDPTKRIRGLWFHDDMERQKLESALEKTLEEIRSQPSSEPQMEPQPLKAQAPQVPDMGNSSADNNSLMESLYPQYGLTKPGDNAPQERVTITMASLRAALHALVDDDAFLGMIMQKLKNSQSGQRPSNMESGQL